jgi:uncharacterized membrane protein YcaP (DUF421 family)
MTFTHNYLYFLSLLAARTVIVFFATAIGLRVLGKRQIGQFTIYDLAMIMALANAVQNAMTSGAGDLTVGFVCAGALLILGRLAAVLFVRWPKLEANACGTPRVLINEGEIIPASMAREHVSHEQLTAALRLHGVRHISDVKLAVLEIDGTLSIVPKEHVQADNSSPDNKLKADS